MEVRVKSGIMLLVVCLTAVFASAQSDAEASTISRVSALEQLWNQAYKSGDTIALASILDDSIVLVNDDGTIQTKAAFLNSVKSSVSQSNVQQQQVAPESLNVHVFGNVAIATGVMRVKGVDRGKPYIRRERFVDTWIKKEANWVCVSTDATPVLQ